MPPKGHRSGSTGRLGARSNSATKINAANLQFTQNPPVSRGGAYDKKTPLARVNSSHRVHSKDHIPPLKRGPSTQRVNTLAAYTTAGANTNTTSKGKGFTLSAKDDHDDDDEGEWESSESGAATPLQNHDSDSEETASEADGPLHHINNALHGHHQQQRRNPEPRQASTATTTNNLPRIETARPSDFSALSQTSAAHDSAEPTSTKTPTLPPPQVSPFFQQMSSNGSSDNHTTNSSNDVTQLQSQLRRMELDSTKETRTDPPQQHPHPQRSSHSRQHQHPSHSQHHPPQHSQSAHTSPRHSQAGTNGSSGRRSRPPSTYSQSGSGPHPGKDLRPHPLIRGLSTGAVNLGRSGAPAPLTVQTGAAPPQLSTSPASSIHHDHTATISPTSTAGSVPASWAEGPAAYLQDRRASVSSARSISTLPGQSLYVKEAPSLLDRARTLSLMTSGSGSSAALSALSHLPVAITRPPSPQPQHQVYFFPPLNPHANVEAIHPLLPASPYLVNHLTVLARRNPLRESWDRVTRAKRECVMSGVGV